MYSIFSKYFSNIYVRQKKTRTNIKKNNSQPKESALPYLAQKSTIHGKAAIKNHKEQYFGLAVRYFDIDDDA